MEICCHWFSNKVLMSKKEFPWGLLALIKYIGHCSKLFEIIYYFQGRYSKALLRVRWTYSICFSLIYYLHFWWIDPCSVLVIDFHTSVMALETFLKIWCCLKFFLISGKQLNKDLSTEGETGWIVGWWQSVSESCFGGVCSRCNNFGN